MRRLLLVVAIGCGSTEKNKEATAPPPESTKTAGIAPETRSSDPQEGGEVTGGNAGPAAQPVAAAPSGAAVGAAPAEPVAAAETAADIDKPTVKKVFDGKASKLKACKAKARVVVKLTVDRTGAVTEASASGGDAEVEMCIVAIVKTLKFPPPKGSAAHITYPLEP